MTVLDVAALAAPLPPAILLGLTLYGPWWRPLVPLQFGAAAVDVALAVAAHRLSAHYVAAGGAALAFAGLIAVAFRDEWIARRAKSLTRWEEFDRDFRAYAKQVGERRNGPPRAT